MLVLESQVLCLTFKVKLGQLTKFLNTQLLNFTFLVICNRGILPAVDKHEVSAGHAMVVDFSASKDGDLGIVTGSSTKKLYRFDRIYTPNDGQGMHNWTYFV